MMPSNPYIAGTPLRSKQGFFGRQDLLDWVTRELHNRGTNALVLWGQRRVGKTSLLLQLEKGLPGDTFLPVYFDLHDQAARLLDEVLFDLADTLADRLALELVAPPERDSRGDFFLQGLLPQIYQAMPEGQRPVFLLDEFDVLDQAVATELPETIAARALLPFLRRLMAQDSRPAFVFVVGRCADDLNVNFASTFKTSLAREVWVLAPKNARALVRQAEANGTLSFDDQAVERILSLTSGHPYLTQLLCQRLWESAYEGDRQEASRITAQDVDAIAPDALEKGENALVWLWDGLTPAEKVYASALAGAAGEDETITEQRLIQTLTDYAFRLRTREVEMAPQDLIKRHVLEKASGHGYRFAVELFRRWVQQYRPLAQVKDELDRVEPVANMYFELGKKLADQHKHRDAIEHFQSALENNPRHFRARVELGEMLLKVQQAAAAVAELEEAYKLDQEEARLPLARALVVWMQELDAAGEEAKTLEVCERVLQVSPKEQKPREIRAAIWTRRGNAARQQGDLEGAMEAYKKAGYKEGIAQVIQIQQRIELEGQAEVLEKNRQWVRAADIYQRLLAECEQESLRQKWARALERVEAQLTVKWVTGGEQSWEPDHVVDERYGIVGQLADTARYEVYLAKELQYPHERVVIKRLKPDKIQEEDALRRFEREVAFLRRVHHPSIQSLYDSKVVGVERYLVTEYADQKSLKDHLDGQLDHKLSPMEALSVALSVAQGLEAAHRQEIIHRDVKPGNILLFSLSDKSRLAKLADFGIARASMPPGEAPLTEHGTWVGTGMYAAPEQIEGELCDARTDLYSWGLVLYEMLTGEIPTASLRDPLTYEPTADEFSLAFLSERGVSAEFGTVLQKVLRADRKLRYQSTGEVCRELEAIRATVIARISQHLQQGENSIQGQEWQLAADRFEQGLQVSREWYGELGGLYGESRELVHRLKMGRYCARGMVELRARSWQAAIEAFEALSKLDPGYLGMDISARLGQARSGLEFDEKRRRLSELRRQASWGETASLTQELATQYADVADEEALAEIQQVARLARGMVCLENRDWRSAIEVLGPLAEQDPSPVEFDLSSVLERAQLGARFEQEYQHLLGLAAGQEWEGVPGLAARLTRDYPGIPTAEQIGEIQVLEGYAQAVMLLEERHWSAAISSLETLQQGARTSRLGLDTATRLRRANLGAKFEQEYQALLRLANQGSWVEVLPKVQELDNQYADIPSSEQAADIHNLAWYAHGQILLGQTQLSRAYEVFYNLYRRAQNYRDVAGLCMDIAFRLGTENERQGDWAHCVQWLERVLSIDERHGDGSTRQRLDSVRQRWAEELRRTDRQAMVEQLEKISPAYEGYGEVYEGLVNNYYQFLRDGRLRATRTQNAQAEAEARYRLGVELWGKGDLQAAAAQLLQIKPQTPEWGAAQTNLVEISLLLGKQELVQEHWQGARKWWSQALEVAARLGQNGHSQAFYALVGEYQYLLRAQRCPPTPLVDLQVEAEARFRVARECWASGDLEGAVEQLEAIGPEANNWAAARDDLYEIYCQLGLRERKRWRLQRALDWFQKAKSLKEHARES